MTKPTKIPTIENCVSDFDALFIPSNRDDRKRFIIDKLSKYKNKTIKNISTGVAIKVIKDCIGETGQHASIDKESTISALNLENLLTYSVIFRENLEPKPNQNQDYKFVEMIEFRCKIKGLGTSKIMVGKRASGKHFEYCITRIDKQKKRQGKS